MVVDFRLLSCLSPHLSVCVGWCCVGVTFRIDGWGFVLDV